MVMRIQVNGEQVELESSVTVEQLLAHLNIDWQGGRVAVEVNMDVIPKAEYPSRMIVEGDAVEVVKFVGGG